MNHLMKKLDEDKDDDVDNNPNYCNNSKSNHLCCVFFGGDKETSHIHIYIYI